MSIGPVLFFSAESALRFEAQLAARGAEALVVRRPEVVPPSDSRAWLRAVSELALFNWVLLPTPAAGEALIESIGAPPGSTQRVAVVGAASGVLRAEQRAPEIDAPGLRAALELLASRIGRRQRVLVPHGALGGHRIGGWLEELGAEVVCVSAYDLDVGAGPPESTAVAAVLADATEAEALAAYVRAGRVPEKLPVAALEESAVDAAEDCGLTAPLVAGERFGPFLDEALS